MSEGEIASDAPASANNSLSLFGKQRLMTREEALARLTAPGEPFELMQVSSATGPIRVFRHAPQNLGEIYAACRSDLPFLVYGKERLTFEDTWVRSCALANALVRDYGVRPGDRVAISMRNYPEWMIGFAAVTAIGGIAVALNAMWQGEALDYSLRDCTPRVLLADQERLDRLAACGRSGNVDVIAVRAKSRVPCPSFDDVIAPHLTDIMPMAKPGSDDDALIIYTSGSTGRPKGVVSSHRAIISTLLSWELDTQIAVLTGLLRPTVADSPQNAVLLGIPLFHVTGLHNVYLASYRRQRRIVSMYKWDPELAGKLIEAERITAFVGPSAVTGDLVEIAREGRFDLGSLKSVGGGGASRSPEQVLAIRTEFPAALPETGWGMTETNALGAGIGAADYIKQPMSTGRPSALLDLRIVDERGQLKPTGETGELLVRGASLMRGYWNQPAATAEIFDKGWLRTGDMARFDDEGFLYIVGRIKEMVIRGGENISCAAVEAALIEHPAVIEACAYGLPHPRLGEELGATVYARGSLKIEDLRRFLRGRIAHFMIPDRIDVTENPLPRVASGKIWRRGLQQVAQTMLGNGRLEREQP